MPRKKAGPKEEPKAVTTAPEAEALEAAPAPSAPPETPPAPPAPPQAPEEAPASAAPEETGGAAPEGRRAVVRSPKGLNLRVGPALSYDAPEVLADGAEVTALDLPRDVTVPGWELVVAGERAGWVSARFLRPLEG